MPPRTPEDVRKNIQEALQAQEAQSAIAARLGVSTRLVGRLAKEYGLQRPQGRHKDEATRTEVRRMRNELGMSHNAIAGELDLSRQRVGQLLDEEEK